MSDESKFTDRWLRSTVEGLIGADRLAEIEGSDDVRDTLWETVVAQGVLTDEQLLGTLSERFRLTLADVTQADKKAREVVNEQVARKYHILPLRLTDSFLEIATANPFDLDCEKNLAFATGREVRSSLASPARIAEKIDEFYRPEDVLDQLIDGMSEAEAEVMQLEDEEEEEFDVSAEEASQRPVVRLVDLILSEGIQSRASDIHIETEEGGIAVRYRIDGVLRQVMKIPRAAGLPLISRIKIISGLDIADRRRPQDGRARVGVNGVPVDLRVSTLPATLGEKVVIRVLDSSRTILSLDSLGFNPEEAGDIKELLDNRDGVILVTGPTGSGKTTTLYSALRFVQSEGINIVTVEDPVEYRLQGVVQVQVHEKAGLTFAAALRSILRQDPDVVLVGEIRDKETANIAVQASLTGHLVLSTLHTNDAPGAVTRLMDVGVDGHKIGTALRGVVAQRLMRRLCSTCKEPWVEEVPKKLGSWIPSDTPLFRAVGCPECAMTGYRGRFSIVEILKMTQEVERRITRGEPADRIADAARDAGMRSLWESGLAHILRGESTIDELLRVVEVPGDDEAAGMAARAAEAVETGKALNEAALQEAIAEVTGGEPGDTESGSQSDEAQSTAAPTAPEVENGVETPPEIEDEPQPSSAGRESSVSGFELIDGGDGTGIGSQDVSVLLVDDEDQLRRVMKDLLERDGFTIFEAVDGVEALDQVDRHAPDVIVLDLNLPNLDGYGVLDKLKAQPATSEIPVIVLTANRDEDNEVRVFEHGATDFLAKPFRARALSARLRAVLGRARS